ncbi:MAG: secondary thiamine-phosphate synthase enzyme YjbQ [Gammaproteobacteria bacterium]|jgi:secondary thiamine-phosphate synthase enzyme|nr:secondary thiamine-phosphate synthase enzyme YjbQ [Gammaproteobacteria bacterium]
MQSTLTIQTSARGLVNITSKVTATLLNADLHTGLCHLFIQHTSASLLIMENADPDVLVDLETFISDLVPDGDPRYQHTAEGPDDMPAHVRSMLTATELTIPVTNGRLNLGSWQGIYLWEHRHRSHTRSIVMTVVDAS